MQDTERVSMRAIIVLHIILTALSLQSLMIFGWRIIITSTNYSGEYQMWQYTGTGRVNGITTTVDMNIARKRTG